MCILRKLLIHIQSIYVQTNNIYHIFMNLKSFYSATISLANNKSGLARVWAVANLQLQELQHEVIKLSL